MTRKIIQFTILCACMVLPLRAQTVFDLQKGIDLDFNMPKTSLGNKLSLVKKQTDANQWVSANRFGGGNSTANISVYATMDGCMAPRQNLFQAKPVFIINDKTSEKYASSFRSRFIGREIFDFVEISKSLSFFEMTLINFAEVTDNIYNNSITLQVRSEEDANQKTETAGGSFFKSDLFYFIGAAALATTFYIVWSNDSKQVAKKTFGYPPKP